MVRHLSEVIDPRRSWTWTTGGIRIALSQKGTAQAALCRPWRTRARDTNRQVAAAGDRDQRTHHRGGDSTEREHAGGLAARRGDEHEGGQHARENRVRHHHRPSLHGTEHTDGGGWRCLHSELGGPLAAPR